MKKKFTGSYIKKSVIYITFFFVEISNYFASNIKMLLSFLDYYERKLKKEKKKVILNN